MLAFWLPPVQRNITHISPQHLAFLVALASSACTWAKHRSRSFSSCSNLPLFGRKTVAEKERGPIFWVIFFYVCGFFLDFFLPTILLLCFSCFFCFSCFSFFLCFSCFSFSVCFSCFFCFFCFSCFSCFFASLLFCFSVSFASLFFRSLSFLITFPWILFFVVSLLFAFWLFCLCPL